MLALGFGFWDDWDLNDKVTFDMFRRLIIVNPDVTTLDVKADVYSAWKRWALIDNNNKIGVVVRAIGGDPTTGVFKAGDIYFLVNGWRLQVDLGQTAILGSIFSDDFVTPLIDFTYSDVFQSQVSNLVTGVSALGGAPSAEENAEQVRTELAVEMAAIISNQLVLNSVQLDTTEIKADVIEINTKLDSCLVASTTILDIISLLQKYEENRTVIDKVANTMTIFDDDNVTPLLQFSLLDSTGTPSTLEVAERLPI